MAESVIDIVDNAVNIELGEKAGQKTLQLNPEPKSVANATRQLLSLTIIYIIFIRSFQDYIIGRILLIIYLYHISLHVISDIYNVSNAYPRQGI